MKKVIKKRVQKGKIREVLKNPKVGAIAGDLYENGSYCVLGGLLHACGVSNDALAHGPQDAGDFPDEWNCALWAQFGLSCEDSEVLMNINDTYEEDERKRRAALRKAVTRELPRYNKASLVSGTGTE